MSASQKSGNVSKHASAESPTAKKSLANDANSKGSGSSKQPAGTSVAESKPGRKSKDSAATILDADSNHTKAGRHSNARTHSSLSNSKVPAASNVSNQSNKEHPSKDSNLKPHDRHPSDPLSTEDEVDSSELQDTTFNDHTEDYNSDLDTESKEDEDAEEEEIERERSRGSILREQFETIIAPEIRETFDKPCRVYKLRGYHSEPDLSLPFEEKFYGRSSFVDEGDDAPPKLGQKYVSCEDIYLSCKEHPELVRGVLSELKLQAYTVDDNMKKSWWELYELEKKRFSFFDELFTMGHVVDSLEVLSKPPKGENVKGEYFIAADEKHFRKKVDYGRMVFKTKHVYTGNLLDWYFEGPGRYAWLDGTVYQGEFSRGVMHGPGTIHWPDGCYYEGHFIHGKRCGWGVYCSADGQNTYAGEWKSGLPHGHGKMWYDPEDDDNDYYEGQWKYGLPGGIGIRQYATGDRYVGNWVDGQRNGYGIMIWLQERQVYKGQWENGLPHGSGKHIWYLERSKTNSFPTRHVYQGNWESGRREGIGKMIYPCGSVYEGRWKNGQRHGKGMYVNPAGDILVGLFRAGSIVGGSDVPLHAPTYEVDYVGLTEWLTAKYKFPLREDHIEEERLMDLTKQYLPHIRKLYHRAGEFSQKYGQHGLYPAYLKPSKKVAAEEKKAAWTSSAPAEEDVYSHGSRNYNRCDEPEHMRAKTHKPEALDGVYPCTRFGLWHLLRDCDNLLDDVTMAYYDKIWCETPPLSFQTRHNPFEPVYLWQFLQALIIASVAYFVDIPNRNRRAADYRQIAREPSAVSESSINAGMSEAEKRRTIYIKAHRARKNSLAQMDLDRENSATTKDQLGGKTKGGRKARKSVKKDEILEANTFSKGTRNSSEEPKHEHRHSRTSSKKKSVPNEATDFGSGEMTINAPFEKSEEDEEEGYYDLGIPDIYREYAGEDGEWDMEEEFEDEEEWEEGHVEEKTAMSISECFQKFLLTKLLPCLKRPPGVNLPITPQPLPALVDMYDAFKGIRQRDVIQGKEFFRSVLPHLIYPGPKETLWWHRCPEPLSHQVDLDAVLEMFREKFQTDQDDTLTEENLNEHKQENEYLGQQAQNSEMTLRILKLCRNDPTEGPCPPITTYIAEDIPMLPPIVSGPDLDLEGEPDIDDLGPLDDIITDGNIFAEEELVPQPFLWADDYKCVPTKRNYQHFENIKTGDFFNALKRLYPNVCKDEADKDLQFEMIFCDWLWCVSLLAKASVEKELQDTFKKNKQERPMTNPQSLGVYAHYVKQIKNNPYLSNNPPADFVPKYRNMQRETEKLTYFEEEDEQEEERKTSFGVQFV